MPNIQHDEPWVNTENEQDCLYWKTKFDCSDHLLKKAIASVGNSAKAVERYLRKVKYQKICRPDFVDSVD